MQRTLTLIRHAKSSWQDAALSDFERPLNKRGRENAPLMGRRLKAWGINFDLVISSPAQRAMTTARLIMAELGCPEQLLIQAQQLYGATVNELLNVTHRLPDEKSHIALVAHNPGLTEFCNYLSGEYIANLPTCSIACITFELETWQAVFRNTGNLSRFEYPRKHTD